MPGPRTRPHPARRARAATGTRMCFNARCPVVEVHEAARAPGHEEGHDRRRRACHRLRHRNGAASAAARRAPRSPARPARRAPRRSDARRWRCTGLRPLAVIFCTSHAELAIDGRTRAARLEEPPALERLRAPPETRTNSCPVGSRRDVEQSEARAAAAMPRRARGRRPYHWPRRNPSDGGSDFHQRQIKGRPRRTLTRAPPDMTWSATTAAPTLGA